MFRIWKICLLSIDSCHPQQDGFMAQISLHFAIVMTVLMMWNPTGLCGILIFITNKIKWQHEKFPSVINHIVFITILWFCHQIVCLEWKCPLFAADSGELVWKGNWVSFLDTMLQAQVMRRASGFRLPTRIKSVRIDPTIHAQFVIPAAEGKEGQLLRILSHSLPTRLEIRDQWTSTI